ncbi:MAG: hypothetical protein WBC06_02410 [Chitinophagaceae bacterium]
MNVQIDQLVKTLLRKESLEQCSLQELEQFAERNPYFGAAQLLLTKKLQVENSEKYNEQLQKTFLYFHNPLWVEHLLNETGNATITNVKKEKDADSSLLIDELNKEPASAIEKEIEFSAPFSEAISKAIENTSLLTTEPAIETPDIKLVQEEPLKQEFTFEPFYTVDYFASQGIKINDDEKPKDKFGQQLKSFTEWLKSMKRLPATELTDRQPENIAEKKVVELAEHSLVQRNITTEAMASVWEKQGNATKAIEIYTKLSLLEPAKSPYFAAKIENLKKKI